MSLKAFLLPVVLAIAVCCSCKKYVDVKGVHDPRLDTNLYCNNPDAVNYNWNFPGTPDSSVCFYPSDIFKGKYTFTDSILTSNYVRDTERTVSLSIIALNRQNILITGFCGAGGDTIHLTADRTFRATADTTIVSGQLLCRPQDTLSGYITRDISDAAHVHFFFTVVSDTGTFFHTGTALKQ